MEKTAHLQSRIWLEEPEPNNPFACRAAYCHGYDVYGEMLGKAGWADMVYLLFKGEAPSRAQVAVLELLAVALANPGPRDPSVHAAMCAGVGGSPAASALMAALAVGAGGAGGGRELFRAMQAWERCGTELSRWRDELIAPASGSEPIEIWPAAEHAAGFDPWGETTATPVRQLLAALAALAPDSRCGWLAEARAALEHVAGRPLSMLGVVAAAFTDLGLSPEQGEMLLLLLRLPGAAAHALEQGGWGHKQFPFYALELESSGTGAVT